MQERWVDVDGVRLRIVVAGPESGEPVVFLHGFPETAEMSWRYQLEWFAGRGYRVVAIDQRGYSLSDKPEGVSAYRLTRLAEDVVAVMQSLGHSVFTVVGHDWGAGVAWQLADQHADRVKRAVILNVPHGVVFKRTLMRRPRQLLRSWYIVFFQLPVLPEWLLARDDCAWLRNTMRRTARPGTFSDDDLERYAAAWRQPGALRAMINWYRGFVRHPVPLDPARKIRVPVLVIWGEQDRFLLKDMAEPSVAMCEQGRLLRLPSASHWVQHEEPERVNAAIEAFLQATPAAAAAGR